MAVDISGMAFFTPIASFVFVMAIMYALLANTKILGGNKFIDIIVSVIIALIFATMASSREYVEKVTPWFVVLIVALFFILVIVGLSQHKIPDIIKPGFVWVFIIVMMVILLGFAINMFSSVNSVFSQIRDFFINQAKFAGALLLIIVAGVVIWLFVKK